MDNESTRGQNEGTPPDKETNLAKVIPVTGQVLLTRKQAAIQLGIQPQTLAAWSCQGTGPPYIKHGRFVRYRVHDLEKWLESQLVQPNGAGGV